MQYRCKATSIEGLVQQVAVSYLRHGYWWYVTGTIPDDKDGCHLDQRLIEKYSIDVTERQRAFRKRNGLANMQYIRYGNFFVLMCTAGKHPFREAEATVIRDARKHPIHVPRVSRKRTRQKSNRAFEGYAISYRPGGFLKKSQAEKQAYKKARAAGRRPPRGIPDKRWHSRVEIERRTFTMLQAYFIDRATRHSVDRLEKELWKLPYEPYAPVREQLLSLIRDVNNQRKRGGCEDLVSYRAVRLKRLQRKPFD